MQSQRIRFVPEWRINPVVPDVPERLETVIKGWLEIRERQAKAWEQFLIVTPDTDAWIEARDLYRALDEFRQFLDGVIRERISESGLARKWIPCCGKLVCLASGHFGMELRVKDALEHLRILSKG